MENTLLVGLSRQAALRRELDVIANNLANLNTTGFKAEGVAFNEFLMPAASDSSFSGPDRRVSFVVDRATWHDHRAGAVERTGNPLDVAIDGNAFLVVQGPTGERYTRNGALQINANGELVDGNGRQALGEGGPIVFQRQDRDISIARDGTVSVINTATNAVIATIQLGMQSPVDLAINPAGTRVYVSNAGGTVQVINTANNTVIGNPIAVPGYARGIAVSPL